MNARSITFAFVFLVGACRAALAWPDAPIRIIAPSPPGGGFDFAARIIADKLSALLGQPVLVDNRTGAGTRVGTEAAAKAAPDGYTLLIGSLSNLALNPGLYPKLAYNSLKDFTPLGLLASYSQTLTSRIDLPQTTLVEVIAEARAHPGKITYGSAGLGTGQQVVPAVMAHLAGVDFTHVPYQGAQAVYVDLIGGRVDLFFDNTATARPLIEAGKIRAIANSGKTREPYLPDTPTVIETGVANVDWEAWFGLFALGKTPQPIVDQLRAAMHKIVVDPSVKTLIEKTGGRALNLTDDAAQALVTADVERWSKLVREAGLTAE